MEAAVHTVLQLGLLYGIATLSGVVSFRFLRFPDLTVDGSFVLGAATTAVLIRSGISPVVAIGVSCLSGFLAGMVTAIWHRAFGVNKFFAGILTMMMLYSLNLRVLGGANLSMLGVNTLFGSMGAVSAWHKTLVAAACSTLIATIVAAVFCSRIGLQIRAMGSNPNALNFTKLRLTLLTIGGLGFANCLAAVSGSLVAQYQRFADVGMGLGIVVNVFASLFLGEVLMLFVLGLMGRTFNFAARFLSTRPHAAGAYVICGELVSASLGMVAFMSILSATLYLGLEPSDTKLCAALLLLIGLVSRRITKSSFLVPSGEYEK